MRTYPYKTNLQVDGVRIPDPAGWNYEVADLDTEAERDATGYLHRNRVATKVNYSFEWKAIEWEMLGRILEAVDKAKFRLVAPDPRTFNRTYSGDYYVGNRDGSALYYLPERPEVAVFDLKLKFIEY